MEADTRLVIGSIMLVLSVIPLFIESMINPTGEIGIVDYILMTLFVIIYLGGWHMIISAVKKAGDKNERN